MLQERVNREEVKGFHTWHVAVVILFLICAWYLKVYGSSLNQRINKDSTTGIEVGESAARASGGLYGLSYIGVV
jgi:hypothetical protein